MLDPRNLDDLVRRLQSMLPAGVGALGAEFREGLREALVALFNRLDLVTREEFEVQVALLERAEAKLAALEAAAEALEMKATAPKQDPPAEP